MSPDLLCYSPLSPDTPHDTAPDTVDLTCDSPMPLSPTSPPKPKRMRRIEGLFQNTPVQDPVQPPVVLPHLRDKTRGDIEKLPKQAFDLVHLLMLRVFYDQFTGKGCCNLIIPCDPEVRGMLLCKPTVKYEDVWGTIFALIKSIGISVDPLLDTAKIVSACFNKVL